MIKKIGIQVIAWGLLAAPMAAVAQTATDSFEVRITIQADCQIVSTETLNFGTAGVLTEAVDTTATMQVTCTNGTGYQIGLNEGTTGTDTATRAMAGGNGQINYQLFSDSGRSTHWGKTAADSVDATGTGSPQNFIIYGRVPVQDTPAPGVYSDTITATVTF